MFKYIQFKVSKSKCAAIILEISRLKFPSTLVSHPICNNVSFYCHIFMFFIDSYNYFIIINWQPLWLEEDNFVQKKSMMCETREYAISVKQKAWLNGAFILTALVASFTNGDIIIQLHPFILTVAARLSESCRMSLHEFCAIWETLCSSIHVNINALQVVSS